MRARFWCWTKAGSETFFSGRMPSKEYAAALRRDGYEIFSGEAALPDWLSPPHSEVRVTMERNLTPGSMPAVKAEGAE